MLAKGLGTPRSPVRGFLADLPGRPQLLWARAMSIDADGSTHLRLSLTSPPRARYLSYIAKAWEDQRG